MPGRGYFIFDTGLGRCGIAWGDHGILGVQLPEAHGIETRRRLFQLYPDPRELGA
jgi:methylated-DNA-[protein]-cysteine S-methyltransferase